MRKASDVQDHDDWVERLQAADESREAALHELRAILLRGMSKSLAQRGGGEAFAEDVVQEAMLKILDSLDTFAGRSRFTTWAMTIANRIAISTLRRRHFQNVSLEQITGDADLKIELPDESYDSPEASSERVEILAILQQLIEAQLTQRQRKVVQAALAGLPMEEIASRMNSNRNAIYKLFHDARRKLRAGLEAEGVSAEDVQAVLGRGG